MEVSSDAMGSFRITLDKAFSSLRWVLTQRNGNPYLKLIEYVGAEEPAVAFSAFSAPFSETELKNSAGQQGLTIPAHAGLYRATQGEFSDDVVFAPQDVRSLTELQPPRFEQTDKFSNDLAAILDRAILWNKARPLTYLAKHWQSGLVKNLYQTVLMRLCGRKWMTAENKISEGEVTPGQWEEMESLVSFPPNFGIAVGKISIEEETRPDDLKEQLSAKLYRYEQHPCDRRLLDVIWRIGWFDTLFLPISANEIEEARSLQVAIRAARLLNLKFAEKTPKVL
ncbi:hypothetical protein RC54_00060 [Herbaspirillum rubrisubalbicans]|uniref:Uncharacterized protein n=2 Tax=Herbaspirillum rubrisubalbicans TaxID=80842 RepID=A0AAD0U367_9BURK|nr:hypothetical protein RC54_00060 [Herbaspirillum rubrisubalbicans]